MQFTISNVTFLCRILFGDFGSFSFWFVGASSFTSALFLLLASSLKAAPPAPTTHEFPRYLFQCATAINFHFQIFFSFVVFYLRLWKGSQLRFSLSHFTSECTFVVSSSLSRWPHSSWRPAPESPRTFAAAT